MDKKHLGYIEISNLPENTEEQRLRKLALVEDWLDREQIEKQVKRLDDGKLVIGISGCFLYLLMFSLPAVAMSILSYIVPGSAMVYFVPTWCLLQTFVFTVLVSGTWVAGSVTLMYNTRERLRRKLNV